MCTCSIRTSSARSVKVTRPIRGYGLSSRIRVADSQVTMTYAESILPFDEETAHVWGRLRVPNAENPLDKQIAATALPAAVGFG
jgi:hypothetical protein